MKEARVDIMKSSAECLAFGDILGRKATQHDQKGKRVLNPSSPYPDLSAEGFADTIQCHRELYVCQAVYNYKEERWR